MSTEINVTIGPQSLVDRNRQQVDANRFRQSEQDAQQRTQAAAEQARQAALAQQGVTPDGASQYGNPRRPEFLRQKPAAFRYGGGGFVLVPDFEYVGDDLRVKSNAFPNLQFSLHEATGYTQTLMTDFDIVQGPTSETLAIRGNTPNFSFGYLFASNYTSGLLDLTSVFKQQLGSYGFGLIGAGYDRSFYANPVYIERLTSGPLANEAARASKYNSYTFEFLIRLSSFDVTAVAFNNIEFEIDGQGEIYVLLGGISSVSIPQGFNTAGRYSLQMGLGVEPDSTGIAIPDIRDGGWHHFSVCKSEDQLRFHIDGQQIFSAVTLSDYWNQYTFAFGPSSEFYIYNIGNLPLMASVGCLTRGFSFPSSVHGLRFTPRALYTTATFEPPTTITTLT